MTDLFQLGVLNPTTEPMQYEGTLNIGGTRYPVAMKPTFGRHLIMFGAQVIGEATKGEGWRGKLEISTVGMPLLLREVDDGALIVFWRYEPEPQVEKPHYFQKQKRTRKKKEGVR